ncbi:membrane protein [Acetobacter sp. DmW_043]|uniref:beta strand repeat-containing protein n=1 Tax=Acetobacter sp. DmW_043 TaxID=1670658 RepID=UPI000A391BFC|nr:calcium-binding protein [Acetobacter sp. DmW_043]OUI89237.1 membrane protein [Acetobacter sp. DmW_043]
MAIITVTGASGSSVQVTVDGSQQSSLVQHASSVAAQLSGDLANLDIRDLTSGSDSFSNQRGYGVITAAGSYQVSGNASWLTVGGISDTLAGAVSVDATGVTNALTVLGGAGGINFTAGSQGGQFTGGAGDNTFNGNSSGGNWDIRTGDGNDTINSGNGDNTINAGGGANQIILGSGVNSVISEGQDTITASSGTQSITLNGASSTVDVGDNSLVTSNAPLGGENITVGSNSTVYGSNSTISGAKGDTISLSGSTGTVFGGNQGTIGAGQGNFVVNQADNANVNIAGDLIFRGGTGETTISAGKSTVFGADGLDVTMDATSASSLFVATVGNETLNAASSVFGIHAFGADSGTTQQIMIGGTGADTLVAGTGNATLTGGSGAANVFGFRNGVAGADYTITDFGSAAGNQVLLVDYDKYYGGSNSSAFQKVLDNAEHSTKNGVASTTITLADNSKITFDGVSSLTAKDFTGF